MEYTDYIDNQTEQTSNVVKEEVAVDIYVKGQALDDTLHDLMHDFVYANYPKERAKELEKKDFLIDTPFVYDHVETESDWAHIEAEAEKSGIATSAEVAAVFNRWNSL